MTYRWVVAALAAVSLLLGWQTWSMARAHQRQVADAAQNRMLLANSAIFDANWELQQVQDPAKPESAALIRQAAEDLIIARERLDALREEAFRSAIPSWDVSELSDRVHVLAGGLKGALESGQLEGVYGDRNFLRVLTENLPFPNQQRDLATFSKSAARVRAIGQQEGFTLKDVPAAPPEMQLVLSGSYSPVKRGSYCWRELDRTSCVDKADSATLVAETTPTPVSPSSKGQLRFAWAPQPASVKLWQQKGGGEPVSVPLDPELTFVLPQESGTYTYRAEARWEPGDGTYAFKVTIK